jgi:hypothetical protein
VESNDPQTYLDGLINANHRLVTRYAKTFDQSNPVNRADLA